MNPQTGKQLSVPATELASGKPAKTVVKGRSVLSKNDLENEMEKKLNLKFGGVTSSLVDVCGDAQDFVVSLLSSFIKQELWERHPDRFKKGKGHLFIFDLRKYVVEARRAGDLAFGALLCQVQLSDVSPTDQFFEAPPPAPIGESLSFNKVFAKVEHFLAEEDALHEIVLDIAQRSILALNAWLENLLEGVNKHSETVALREIQNLFNERLGAVAKELFLYPFALDGVSFKNEDSYQGAYVLGSLYGHVKDRIKLAPAASVSRGEGLAALVTTKMSLKLTKSKTAFVNKNRSLAFNCGSIRSGREYADNYPEFCWAEDFMYLSQEPVVQPLVFHSEIQKTMLIVAYRRELAMARGSELPIKLNGLRADIRAILNRNDLVAPVLKMHQMAPIPATGIVIPANGAALPTGQGNIVQDYRNEVTVLIGKLIRWCSADSRDSSRIPQLIEVLVAVQGCDHVGRLQRIKSQLGTGNEDAEITHLLNELKHV